MSIGDRNSRIPLHRRCHYEDHCMSGIWWRYRIVGDFQGKKLSQVLRFCGNLWKFSLWIWGHGICWLGKRVFFPTNLHKFSSLKVSRYTVFILQELLVYICWCGNVCLGSWAEWGCISKPFFWCMIARRASTMNIMLYSWSRCSDRQSHESDT